METEIDWYAAEDEDDVTARGPNSSLSSTNEAGHYVVTAQPPGAVLHSMKCSFLAPGSVDVIIAKSRRLEVRQLSDASSEEMASLPVVLSAPINGRIATLLSFRHPSSETDYIFFTTETKQYAVLSYVAPEDADSNAVYNLVTHASGNLADHGMALRGNEPESGPIAALEPNHTCIALHLYEGFVTILPIQKSYHYSSKSLSAATNVSKRGGRHSEILGHAFHCRIEERDVYSMSFLLSTDISGRYMPQLAFLHQDSRGNQHVVAHSINLQEKSIVLHSAVSPIGSNVKKAAVPPLVQHRLKKNRVDGASGLIIAVPPVGWSEKNTDLSEKGDNNVDDIAPPFGGILIVGEQQITFHDTAKNCTEILPTPQRLTLTCARVHPLAASTNNADHDIVRYLLGDEDGTLHVLAVIRSVNGNAIRLQIETLGVTNISSSLLYLERGLVFVGSQSCDSQFIQILDKPIRLSDEEKSDEDDLIMSGQNLTHVHVLDEYKNLGPIVDFDVIPMSHNSYAVVNDSLASQCMAVTASGTEKDGSVRFIRNGTGFFEHASVELGGIKGMWALRKSFHDHDDAFLVQSYMGETRILGVTMEDSGKEGIASDRDGTSATLSEMQLPDFECENMTLYAGNVIVDTESDLSLFLQITKRTIRLISLARSQCVSKLSAQHGESFTIASANESGQIIVVSKGGKIEYLQIVRSENNGLKIALKGVAQIGNEVSCVNLNAFEESIPKPAIKDVGTSMEIDFELSAGRSTPRSKIVVVGLWDETNLLVLSLDDASPLRTISRIQLNCEVPGQQTCYSNVAQKMARSVCLVTLGSLGYRSDFTKGENDRKEAKNGVNMLLIGLGNGVLISFVANEKHDGSWDFTSRREVSIGTRALNLVVFSKHSGTRGACVLATGDRPTIIYLSGGAVKSSKTSRLCYSNIHLSCDDEFENGVEPSMEKNAQLIVNFSAPFRASSLLDDSLNYSDESYSLCVSDDTTMRVGTIDNIQKLHVTTHKLGMPPRKVAHDVRNRLLCVGCIDQNTSSLQYSNRAETNMGNCVRLFDDSTFEEIDRIDLDPYEMILSLICTQLKVTTYDDFTPETSTIKESEHADAPDSFDPYIILGTGYGFPEDDEPSRGRIIVLECNKDRSNSIFSRKVKKVAELQVRGGVFSLCPFYDGSILASINSKTRLCRLVGQENNGVLDLKIVGAGHHGHIMSLVVKSLSEEISNADNNKREQLAIVGDMVRSISVLKYYSEYQTLEEIARDFNQNWVTAVEMLTDNIYLGAENFNNIFALRRNPNSSSQEVRCRLDTIGVFHIGEMVNKFLKGSLVLPSHAAGNTGNISTFGQYLGDGNDGHRKMTPNLGSQTLFGTVDGTLGSIIGLDANSSLFFMALQRSMAKIVKPVGYLKHGDYRSFRIPRSCQPSRGFIDGDFVESFAELDPAMMEAIVQEMNKEGKWYKVERNDNNGKNDAAKKELRPKLTVEEVLTMIEDMTMAH